MCREGARETVGSVQRCVKLGKNESTAGLGTAIIFRKPVSGLYVSHLRDTLRIDETTMQKTRAMFFPRFFLNACVHLSRVSNRRTGGLEKTDTVSPAKQCGERRKKRWWSM